MSTTAKVKPPTTIKPVDNRFADLCDSDSEDEEVASMPVKAKPQARVSEMDWAANESDDEPPAPPVEKIKPRVKKTWAEMCDEEDEEDW